jgi:hypothetical protein
MDPANLSQQTTKKIDHRSVQLEGLLGRGKETPEPCEACSLGPIMVSPNRLHYDVRYRLPAAPLQFAELLCLGVTCSFSNGRRALGRRRTGLVCTVLRRRRSRRPIRRPRMATRSPSTRASRGSSSRRSTSRLRPRQRSTQQLGPAGGSGR